MNDYKDLIVKNKLADNVLLKGYTDNITETLNTFDLFVLSSRYEGIPYVILEAMKESIPVLSTNVGGIGEVIKDNFNGILVKKENAVELAEKAIVLYNSEHTRKYLSENARRDFEEKYTIEKTIKDIDSTYSGL